MKVLLVLCLSALPASSSVSPVYELVSYRSRSLAETDFDAACEQLKDKFTNCQCNEAAGSAAVGVQSVSATIACQGKSRLGGNLLKLVPLGEDGEVLFPLYIASRLAHLHHLSRFPPCLWSSNLMN